MVFDEDEFDKKVAKIINKTHRKRFDYKKYNEWINDNIHDLKRLFKLSNLDCSEETFYSYMYDHSNYKL